MIFHLGDVGGVDAAVARVDHFLAGGQVGPQLKTHQRALRAAFGHFLVDDAAAGRHPLHIAGVDHARIPHRIAMLHVSIQQVGDRLNAAVRVPGEASLELGGVIPAEIIEKEERVKCAALAGGKATAQVNSGAFQCGPAGIGSGNDPGQRAQQASLKEEWEIVKVSYHKCRRGETEFWLQEFSGKRATANRLVSYKTL